MELVTEELRIPVGETRGLDFGTLPQQDTTVRLEITARMDSPGLGGSMFFMELKLNGRPVLPAKSRTVTRLVNKPLVSPVAPDLPSGWYGAGGWRVVYAPDFEAAKGQPYYVGDPYQLVLDVTDLTNPAAENRLEITNTASAELAERLKCSLDLVIGRLTVRTQPGTSPTMAAANALEPVINRGEPGAGPAEYRGEVLPGGGFALTVNGKRLAFDTAFSYPNAGFNRLLPSSPPYEGGAGGSDPRRQGQPGWRVEVVDTPADSEVRAQGPDYAVRRTIRFTPRRVEIADEITNAHPDADLGLLVRHSVALKDYPEAGVRIAGNPDPSVNDYYAPANPSVHISFDDWGLGQYLSNKG
jgi:hypothetical protein